MPVRGTSGSVRFGPQGRHGSFQGKSRGWPATSALVAWEKHETSYHRHQTFQFRKPQDRRGRARMGRYGRSVRSESSVILPGEPEHRNINAFSSTRPHPLGPIRS